MRSIYYLLIALVVIAMLVIAEMAHAQGMCQPYAAFVKVLKDKFGETSIGKGLAGEVVIIEIFASPETFTILATRVDGHSCIIAAGKGWERVAPKPVEEEL